MALEGEMWRKYRICISIGFIILFLLARFFICKETILFAKNTLADSLKGECDYRECGKLISDAVCFPVQKKSGTTFEDGYGDGRSYGGKRRHEGIDIIPEKNKENSYKIISVSDGVVEKMGWLELGGYRIGIRSKGGFYFYYAHLSSYNNKIKKGTVVKAGDFLGYMGNTGYGKKGTRGKFIVHLHFGIYHQVNGREKSFNPYRLLCYLQNR